jgi:hypothetical protein
VNERVLVSSDGPRYPHGGAPKSLSAVTRELGDARPHVQEAPMRNGRPTALEQRRRQHEFLRLLAAGSSWRDAAKTVGMKAGTVLTMLDQPEFATVAAALLDGRAHVAAVTVAPEIEAAAA